MNFIIMRPVEKLTKSKVVDWPAVSAWVPADIATRFQASPEFMDAETLRKQCWHAYQVLRENHTRAVPDSVIGKILGIDKGTPTYHSKHCEALSAALIRNERPSILSADHRKGLVRQIAEAYLYSIPWMTAEIL
jgi:hypothetical protein